MCLHSLYFSKFIKYDERIYCSGVLGSTEVAELNWGDTAQIESLNPPFDYIIGADIVTIPCSILCLLVKFKFDMIVSFEVRYISIVHQCVCIICIPINFMHAHMLSMQYVFCIYVHASTHNVCICIFPHIFSHMISVLQCVGIQGAVTGATLGNLSWFGRTQNHYIGVNPELLHCFCNPIIYHLFLILLP